MNEKRHEYFNQEIKLLKLVDSFSELNTDDFIPRNLILFAHDSVTHPFITQTFKGIKIFEYLFIF